MVLKYSRYYASYSFRFYRVEIASCTRFSGLDCIVIPRKEVGTRYNPLQYLRASQGMRDA